MSNFHQFAAVIKAQYDEMSKGELFVVGIGGDALYEAYLGAFPAGTNEIFRERTEHDCSCCRNFIRNIGNVVAVINGRLRSVWDAAAVSNDIDGHYQTVAQTMSAIVLTKSITGLFRATEPTYGAEETKELREGQRVHTWHHFHAKVAAKHYVKKDAASSAAARIGEYASMVQVFRRGLGELKVEAFNTVYELIATSNLYRGEEHKAALLGFMALQADYYTTLTEGDKELFVWTNASNPFSRIRNTAIGTLLVDLSGRPASEDGDARDPVPLEQAVKSFEDKMSGTNYKRPTALITPTMVKQAMVTIQTLGLEPALDRRFAKLSDVSVNNVLWVDNSVQSQMKGGIEGLLMEAAAPAAVNTDNAIDITIDQFMADVLPTATGLQLLVKNAQQGNFMSLTAPVHADVEQLFKWSNNFGWSYNGNITDSPLRQKVQNLGGRVDGVLRFSHTWNYDARNASLMDLHVFMPGSSRHDDGIHDCYPGGQRVGWNQRKDSASGGVQDVDYTTAAPEGYVPVENITFPELSRLKDGDYTFKIHNWAFREPTKGGFKAEIEFDGQIFQYDHPQALKNKEWITLATATLKKGTFTIQHHHDVGVSSQEVWGITTEQFTKVQTVMFSPNYWDDNASGNKHWFFLLDGCCNPTPARGIYNEFLKSGLEQHRKVFEVLGEKTKCLPTAVQDQLSGVGFSSTKKDVVTVQVTAGKTRKTYNINF